MSYPESSGQLPMVPEQTTRARRDVLSTDIAAGVAATFNALADPTRVRIVSALVGVDELCVGELAEALGMTISAISHQLRLLRELHIVRARRAGRHMFYALDDEHVRMMFQQGLDHLHYGQGS